MPGYLPFVEQSISIRKVIPTNCRAFDFKLQLIFFCIAAKDQSNEPIADDVVVAMTDFQAAIQMFIPSISKDDIAYFEQLKNNFSV